MNPQYTYFLILAASLAGPLVLSFDRKVAFYRKWKYLFPAMILPAVFYIAWDVWFTHMGIWSFNPKYVSGIYLFNLPIEEVLFFIIVPYCCVFIYECIKVYFIKIEASRTAHMMLVVLALTTAIAAIVFSDRYYSLFAFGLLAIFISIFLIFPASFRHFKPAVFLISYTIILIPFLVINGFLTAIPVILYNNEENSGFRLYSIPVEDIFYGMLLIMMNVAGFEVARHSQKSQGGRHENKKPVAARVDQSR